MIEMNNKKEHILVCLSSSPSNPKVIHTAAKMAKVFDAEFTALYIEPLNPEKITPENKKRLNDNIELAKNNNANVVTVKGDDIPSLVSVYAKESRVTKIIIGRTGYRQNKLFNPPDFADKLISLAGNIEIYIIPDKAQQIYLGNGSADKCKEKSLFIELISTLFILSFMTIIGILFSKLGVNSVNILLLYIFAILMVSYITDKKIYSLTAAVISVVSFDFLFAEPAYSIKFFDNSYILTFGLMVLIAIFSSHLTMQLKGQTKQAVLNANNIESMLELSRELQIKNKQEELRSVLLRTISHDLRTPLTGISGFAELLINNSDSLSEDKKKKIYYEIYDDAVWLYNLVENILSITRFDNNEIKLKKESEYITDIVNEAISHLGRKREQYDIHIDIDDDNLSAKVDGRLITQVVFNLVDNATKYSDPGTKIIIKASKKEKNIEISVADEGRGISDEDKQKIFDIFYTANKSSADSNRSMGLGLALCKAVIKAHSGKISIKDNYPRGTVFSFVIKGEDNE